MKIENFPENLTVTDANGIPDHSVQPQQVMEDGFTLACKIGASRGNQDEITEATSEVLTKWGDRAGYVLASGITQLGRDLVPMAAQLLKTSSGVDWAAHCAALLEPDYDPTKVDKPSPRDTDPMQSGEPVDGSAPQMRKGERLGPTPDGVENIVNRNYLERVAETADHIQECSEFLATHVSNGGEYDLDDGDGLQLARDLIHTINTDTQKLKLLLADAPCSQSTEEQPSYITMESRIMTPDETDEHMRQTLTPEEYAEWSKPPSPAEQAEMDQFDAEWASMPASEKTTLRHMRATRTDLRRAQDPGDNTAGQTHP